MNERIKELAEQAFMVCLKGADEKHLEQLERFAELVRQDEREQEPVAWDGNCVLGHCGSPDGCDRSGCCRADLAPPKREWVGLTDEEIVACGWCDLRFARAIETKLKGRNT
jgi:hypothetical protein